MKESHGPLSIKEIKSEINKLCVKKAAGIDLIINNMLKKTTAEISCEIDALI